MARQTNGTGQGGKSFQDRQLAADLRTLTLNEIKLIIEINGGTTPDKKRPKGAKNKKLYEGVILNLSKSILPRLQEVAGEGGGPVQVSIVTLNAKGTNTNA